MNSVRPSRGFGKFLLRDFMSRVPLCDTWHLRKVLGVWEHNIQLSFGTEVPCGLIRSLAIDEWQARITARFADSRLYSALRPSVRRKVLSVNVGGLSPDGNMFSGDRTLRPYHQVVYDRYHDLILNHHEAYFRQGDFFSDLEQRQAAIGEFDRHKVLQVVRQLLEKLHGVRQLYFDEWPSFVAGRVIAFELLKCSELFLVLFREIDRVPPGSSL